MTDIVVVLMWMPWRKFIRRAWSMEMGLAASLNMGSLSFTRQ